MDLVAGSNLGNAVGAYFGGISVSSGGGYSGTALIGAGFAAAGFLLLLLYARRYGKDGGKTGKVDPGVHSA